MLKSTCNMCGHKISTFISNDPKGHGILSSLGIKTPLSRIPWLNILF